MLINSKAVKIALVVSGLIGTLIGAALLFSPEVMHASNGVELGNNPSLLSEVRAPGGALMMLSLIVLVGAFVSWLRFTALTIAMVVYLAYGGSRLLSIALDGLPAPGLLAALAVELVLGGVVATLWARSRGQVQIQA